MHLQLCLLFTAPTKPVACLALTANLAWHLAAGSGGVAWAWPTVEEDFVAVFPPPVIGGGGEG